MFQTCCRRFILLQACGYPLLFCLNTVLVAKGLGWYWFVRAGVHVLQLALKPWHFRWNLPHTVWIANLPVSIDWVQAATTWIGTKGACTYKLVLYMHVMSKACNMHAWLFCMACTLLVQLNGIYHASCIHPSIAHVDTRLMLSPCQSSSLILHDSVHMQTACQPTLFFSIHPPSLCSKMPLQLSSC